MSMPRRIAWPLMCAALWLPACSPDHAAKLGVQTTQVQADIPTPLTVQQKKDTYAQTFATGMQRVTAGDYGTALGDFEHALQLNPNSCEALIAIGACHESIGDPVEAIRHYRLALQLNPLEPDAYANLGTAYIKLFHRENNPTWRRMATDAWRQSLSLNPDQADLREYLSRETADAVR